MELHMRLELQVWENIKYIGVDVSPLIFIIIIIIIYLLYQSYHVNKESRVFQTTFFYLLLLLSSYSLSTLKLRVLSSSCLKYKFCLSNVIWMENSG